MTDAPPTPARFERIMFASIVPALVLPAIAAITAIIGTSNLPSDGELDGPIAGLVVAVYMFVLGAGLGMVMQNLTLIVQNDTPPQQLGAASSNVALPQSCWNSSIRHAFLP